tara:strand:- start:805 stop:1011 length:207 start_codon:yes stop_codon:yes gene_type:complete
MTMKYNDLLDTILKLDREGNNLDQIFFNIADRITLKNKTERQAIADLIAQLILMNVFAKGIIPTTKAS